MSAINLISLYTCILASTFFLCCYGAPLLNPGHVITLTASNFSSTIDQAEGVLVEFYAPWCVHCQKFSPEYEAAAAELKGISAKVLLAKVDATEETELSTQYNIRGYPTLKFFRGKKEMEFNGERTKRGVVSWIQQMTGPSVVWVEDKVKAIEQLKPNVTLYVAKIFSKQSSGAKLFEEYAENHRSQGTFVAYMVNEVKGDNETVTVFHQGEGESNEMELTSAESLSSFCKKEHLPLFGPIDANNFEDYYNSGYDLIWFSGIEDDYHEAGKIIREAAKIARDQYRFLWLNTATFPGHAQSVLGVTKTPAITAQINDSRYIYPSNEFNNVQKIIEFLDDAKNGKITKFLLSEEIPKDNNGPVTIVVGKTFNDIVLQKDKDVLLEVYAPWCGHCKKLEPIYLDFAKQMRKYTHLVVAKMDGTANESPNPNFTWGGFPTIMFVKAGTEIPIPYSGERTIEALKNFVAQHQTDTSTQIERDEL